MRALGGSCVKIGQSSFGVITALLRVRGLNLEGRERVEPCAALLQRVACGHILFNQRAAKIFGFAFGALPCLLHFRGGAAGKRMMGCRIKLTRGSVQRSLGVKHQRQQL